MPARYAVINANGTVNWSRDPNLTAVTPSALGRYLLDFAFPCNEDVFVIHAKTAGPGCDAPRVVVTTIQDGPTRICVAIADLVNPAEAIGAQFSYIRYPKADEFMINAQGVEEQRSAEGGSVPCQATETKGWYAWIDLMPPGPFDLHVIGDVFVANPGVTPLLVPKQPQGVNPRILLLDLYLRQEPGFWPQVLVWKQARYDRVLIGDERYERVQILCGDAVIADLEVHEVH